MNKLVLSKCSRGKISIVLGMNSHSLFKSENHLKIVKLTFMQVNIHFSEVVFYTLFWIGHSVHSFKSKLLKKIIGKTKSSKRANSFEKTEFSLFLRDFHSLRLQSHTSILYTVFTIRYMINSPPQTRFHSFHATSLESRLWQRANHIA